MLLDRGGLVRRQQAGELTKTAAVPRAGDIAEQLRFTLHQGFRVVVGDFQEDLLLFILFTTPLTFIDRGVAQHLSQPDNLDIADNIPVAVHKRFVLGRTVRFLTPHIAVR